MGRGLAERSTSGDGRALQATGLEPPQRRVEFQLVRRARGKPDPGFHGHHSGRVQGRRQSELRRRPVTVTLLALGMDTFIFGAASGEALCARSDAQGLLGDSTMATGVTILLLGITLLQ